MGQQEVTTFLHSIGFGHKAEVFEENAVDGSMLDSLTPEDMKEELKFSKIQARKISQAYEKLLNGCRPSTSTGTGGGGGGKNGTGAGATKSSTQRTSSSSSVAAAARSSVPDAPSAPIEEAPLPPPSA